MLKTGAALTLIASLASVSAGQVYTRRNSNGVVEATNVPDSAAFNLTYPGKGTLIHSRGFHRNQAYWSMYDHHVDEAARLHQVSSDLVKAVIAVESEFDQWAVSSKGAQGLMQLMPFTARRFGVSDPFDPRQNIFGGVQYLRLLLDLFQGDVALGLAAYNAGENAVARYRGIPPFRETRGYVQKIQALLEGGIDALRAAFYAPPARPLLAPAAATRSSKPAKITPARPRVYYKWKDGGGTLHVAHTPPPEGVVYTMIRALD